MIKTKVRKARGLTKKSRNGLYEKICNICGERCYVYTVIDNGIFCSNCVPANQIKKSIKIINEAKMVQKILGI